MAGPGVDANPFLKLGPGDVVINIVPTASLMGHVPPEPPDLVTITTTHSMPDSNSVRRVISCQQDDPCSREKRMVRQHKNPNFRTIFLTCRIKAGNSQGKRI